MSSSWENGSTREWRKIRGRVLKRDSNLCQLRIAEVCRGRADCVHHTHGRAVTGDNPAYLVAACTPCNLRVGDPAKSKQRKSPADPAPAPRTTW